MTTSHPNFIGTSGQRSSRSAFARSTGNDVSGHYKRHCFPFFPFFLRHDLFSWKEFLDQKNLFCESWQNHPDPVDHLGALGRPFWILQAVRRGGAGGERVPPALLGWYLFQRKIEIDLLIMTTCFETLFGCSMEILLLSAWDLRRLSDS